MHRHLGAACARGCSSAIGPPPQPVAPTLMPPAMSTCSTWASIRGWFEEHSNHLVIGAVSAGALAALTLGIGTRAGVVHRVVRDGAAVGDSTPPSLRSQPPEVEDLEVCGGSSTILTIGPDGDDDSAA